MESRGIEYECVLTPESLKKAQDELNEDPSERMAAVNALRQWVKEQPHIQALTDTLLLLGFLRTSKFSQLKARKMIEKFCTIHTTLPQWFSNIDTKDERIMTLLDTGYMIPLPGVDDNGCKVLFQRIGCIDPYSKQYNLSDQIRLACVIASYFSQDENIQVNGFVFVVDLTGVSAKHLKIWSVEDVKKWSSCWQGSLPGRFKAFHFYNGGKMLELAMNLINPVLKKKFKERVVVHSTLESLYDSVPLRMLPEEYLPDDFNSTDVGNIKKIIDEFKEAIHQEHFHSLSLQISKKGAFWIDVSKQPAISEQASYRKLNNM